MSEETVERRAGKRIAAFAEAQHGVISAAQLYALGLSKDQVSERARAGWLHRVHRGVYSMGRLRLTLEGHLMAAVLARPGAVVSHWSAAVLWRILDPQGRAWGRRRWRPEVHVTRAGLGTRAASDAIVIHRTTTLRDGEVTTEAGIPVTTPLRTLLDLATVLRGRSLERTIDEAERLHGCTEARLRAMLELHRGEPGTGALRRMLRTHTVGSTATRSVLEERFLSLCRAHRLPQPAVNAPLHGLTVDFLWEAARLVVEVDGRDTHHTRRAFEDDRDRDSLLAAHGYLTLRFTWRDVTRRAPVVAQRVRRVLSDRAD